MVEQEAVNFEVVSSSLTGGANFYVFEKDNPGYPGIISFSVGSVAACTISW